MNSPLLCIDLVLNDQQNAAALQDLGPVIADFLGPDCNLSLHDACCLGSLKLLDWIWRISRFCEPRASNWSISAYLQSNRHYYKWQFSESLEVAASRGDLKIVKWLFERFKNCEVTVEVVETAAKNGQLQLLQFLKENERTSSHTVHWGGRSLVEAVENGHSEVAHWLFQQTTNEYGEAQVTNTIKTALRVGDVKMAEFLLPQGKCILDYAEFCSNPDIIEWKLDCGYFKRDAFSSGVAIKYLVPSGRLDLMQRIAELHEPPPDNSDWPTNWRSAMVLACVYGDLSILQWLMDHPGGRWILQGDDRLFSELVFSAAYNGNIAVMEFLYDRGAIDKVRDAMVHVIRENHLDMVKWLIKHFPESERIPDYCVMDEAARYGRLEMLQYFQELDDFVVPGYSRSVTSLRRRRARSSSGDKFMAQMFVPASDDYLKVHPTLCRYRSEWLPTEPMDDAAANGHLEVVKWLHFNRSEGCTTAAMDCAAANGHLEVVTWLHTHRLEGCTNKAMDGAAENGHLDVIQWLYKNRFEGCTVKAIEGAMSNNHLRVAVWLHTHWPALHPLHFELRHHSNGVFERMLFQFSHFSNSFNSNFVEDIKETLLEASTKSNHKHINDWLQETFPTAFGTREWPEW
ncbi:putative ankyrin repeat protein [Phytophthora citrophthora]|uniref:Ankyrin repeat protein n=1 Tax=Phytophthora citrophthora TaxID=4793 RepID=A0AAD9G101_9STRA|nr:putative ankyrin repeat protein [Phytophthora citrophthora]